MWKARKGAVHHPQHLLHHFLHFLIQTLDKLGHLTRSSLPHRYHCCFQTKARGWHALPRTISSSHQSNDDVEQVSREVSITSLIIVMLKRRTSIIVSVQRVTASSQQSVDNLNKWDACCMIKWSLAIFVGNFRICSSFQ